MRILVVEDNDLVADAITMGLGAAGFAVDRSASAEAASNALATEHFDLLVVDVGLPQEDGLSLVRRLRARGSTQPVLILTARDTLAIKVEALNLGADDFLLKPFEQNSWHAAAHSSVGPTCMPVSRSISGGCGWTYRAGCCASMRRRWT